MKQYAFHLLERQQGRSGDAQPQESGKLEKRSSLMIMQRRKNFHDSFTRLIFLTGHFQAISDISGYSRPSFIVTKNLAGTFGDTHVLARRSIRDATLMIDSNPVVDISNGLCRTDLDAQLAADAPDLADGLDILAEILRGASHLHPGL